MSLKAYLESKCEEVDEWLRRLLEAIFVAEYGLDADEQSALNLIDMTGTDPTEFKPLGESDERFRIKGGSSALPKALHTKIRERADFVIASVRVKLIYVHLLGNGWVCLVLVSHTSNTPKSNAN